MEDFKTKIEAMRGVVEKNYTKLNKLLEDPILKSDNPETTEIKENIRLAHRYLVGAQICLYKIIKIYEESATANAFDKAFENKDKPPS